MNAHERSQIAGKRRHTALLLDLSYCLNFLPIRANYIFSSQIPCEWVSLIMKLVTEQIHGRRTTRLVSSMSKYNG